MYMEIIEWFAHLRVKQRCSFFRPRKTTVGRRSGRIVEWPERSQVIAYAHGFDQRNVLARCTHTVSPTTPLRHHQVKYIGVRINCTRKNRSIRRSQLRRKASSIRKPRETFHFRLLLSSSSTRHSSNHLLPSIFQEVLLNNYVPRNLARVPGIF